MNQQQLYIVLCDGSEWEDAIIFTSLYDAQSHLLETFVKRGCRLNLRIEIFCRVGSHYLPAYETMWLNHQSDFKNVVIGNVPYPSSWFVKKHFS